MEFGLKILTILSITELVIGHRKCLQDELSPHEDNRFDYYKCVKGKNILKNCPYGHYFHKKQKKCVALSVEVSLKHAEFEELSKKKQSMSSSYFPSTKEELRIRLKQNKKNKKGKRSKVNLKQLLFWEPAPIPSTTNSDAYIASEPVTDKIPVLSQTVFEYVSHVSDSTTSAVKVDSVKNTTEKSTIIISTTTSKLPESTSKKTITKTTAPTQISTRGANENTSDATDIHGTASTVNLAKKSRKRNRGKKSTTQKMELLKSSTETPTKTVKSKPKSLQLLRATIFKKTKSDKLRWKPRLSLRPTVKPSRNRLNKNLIPKAVRAHNLQTFPPVYMAPKSDYEIETATVEATKTTVTKFLEQYLEPITKSIYDLGLYPDMNWKRVMGGKESNPTPISPIYQTDLEEKDLMMY